MIRFYKYYIKENTYPMPHAGLMDEEALGPEAGPLRRARLHIRGGKRRLRQGKIAEGIITLYDALISAMEWYFASPARVDNLTIREEDDLKNDKVLFQILSRSGVLDGSFDYGAFNELVEKILYHDLREIKYGKVLQGIESVMVQLGVMPFDEAGLPPEDPSTF
jgi:hypothetical protein